MLTFVCIDIKVDWAARAGDLATEGGRTDCGWTDVDDHDATRTNFRRA